jgi:indole-3-glycerol phosphate synthase
MNILEEIYNYKLDFVKRAKTLRSLDELIDQSNAIKKKEFEFSAKLKKNEEINIIGELKKASPSAGNIIDDNIDLMEIAKTYDDIGVSYFSSVKIEKQETPISS